MASHTAVLYVDGSSRGNPGPAGIGVAVFTPENQKYPIDQVSKYIGITTNNVAEYEAVIRALVWIKQSSFKRVVIKLDSELVYKQLTGVYRVRTPHIALLNRRAVRLCEQLPDVTFMLVPRSKNTIADALAQKASKTGKRKKQKIEQRKLIT